MPHAVGDHVSFDAGGGLKAVGIVARVEEDCVCVRYAHQVIPIPKDQVTEVPRPSLARTGVGTGAPAAAPAPPTGMAAPAAAIEQQRTAIEAANATTLAGLPAADQQTKIPPDPA